MNFNKAFILGRVTKEVQVKTTPTGKPVATFSIATNQVWTDKSGKKNEKADFHNIVLWGRLAEIAGQYLLKGSEVLIVGRITTRSWDDKQGVKRYTTEIVGETMQLGAKPSGAKAPATAAAPQPKADTEEDVPIIDLEEEIKAEDLPF